MSTNSEIFELAQLEVIGALEPTESARLERMFRDASPTLQREVVEFQAALATEGALLPSVNPEGSLRLRVLASVAEAVEAHDDQLAPIASIGRGGRAMSALGNGRNEDDSTQSKPRDEIAQAAAPWRKSSLVWRTASIVLAGALLASLAFNIATTRQSARISELALQRSVSEELRAMVGADLPAFLDKRCIVRGLVGSTLRDNGSASVMLTPDFTQVMVLWVDLPTSESYTLRAIDPATGDVSELGSVLTVNPVGGTNLKIAPGKATAASDWQLVDDRGTVVYSSRPQ